MLLKKSSDLQNPPVSYYVINWHWLSFKVKERFRHHPNILFTKHGSGSSKTALKKNRVYLSHSFLPFLAGLSSSTSSCVEVSRALFLDRIRTGVLFS